MADDVNAGLKKLFDERRRFVIIGLTGRTGSGCTTAGRMLSLSFDDLNPPRPYVDNYTTDEDRKYRICWEYARSNWSQFYIIRIRDIITSFILEYPFHTFKSFLADTLRRDVDRIKMPATFSSRFDEMHEIRKKVKALIAANEETGIRDIVTGIFYLDQLSAFTNELHSILNKLAKNGFTRIFQVVGTNIRTSGLPYSNSFNADNFHKLAQRTNVVIKILRKRSKTTGEPVSVVIDSIRNPYEAAFFKERYSAFYLFSVTTEENSRKARLRKVFKINDEQIEVIDSKEYPKGMKGVDKFCSLDIRACIQRADIHIYNPDEDGDDFPRLKKQLIRYIALIRHPGLVTPSKQERIMQIAHVAKANSGCISRQVGAVVTDRNFSIKSVGWNDTAKNQVPCLIRSAENYLNSEDLDSFSDFERKNTGFKKLLKEYYKPLLKHKLRQGHNITYCFKDIKNCLDGEKNQVHTRALHAEENAFLQLTKYGTPGIDGGILFTTASPCELCSKKAYQLGITDIFFIDPYPGIAEEHILGIGPMRPVLHLFEGAIGRAYQQLFEPIMPQKDELEMTFDIKFPTKVSAYEEEIGRLKKTISERDEYISQLQQRPIRQSNGNTRRAIVAKKDGSIEGSEV